MAGLVAAGDLLGGELCKALGLGPHLVTRLTITCDAEDAARARVEVLVPADAIAVLGEIMRRHRHDVDVVTVREGGPADGG